MTLTKAYAALGATVKARPQTWSHMSDDRQTAIVTLWRDHQTPNRKAADVPTPDRPNHAPNQNRIAHLRHALAHNGGRFRAIHATRSRNAPTRMGSARGSFEPDLDHWWCVKKLEKTGAFRAEVVTT